MIYDLLAPIYDKVNAELDYKSWADFIEKAVERHGSQKPELVLDLGCGTGKMTLELARRGYDMTGVDYSPEMLDIAGKAEAEAKIKGSVLWLCQDMREFELYGTVDLAVCCLDGINHLTGAGDLKKCLKLVHNYLVPDGLFIFDINGKRKFESTYGDSSYVIEEGDDLCVWQNYYDSKSRLCSFLITLFHAEADGRYSRYDEEQSERMFTLRAMRQALLTEGFEFIGAYSDFDFNQATDEDERIYIVAKCKKG